MSEPWQLAIVGGILTIMTICITALGVMVWYKLREIDGIKRDIVKKDMDGEHRMTKIETQLEQLEKKAEHWFVVNAAKGLHSPDNHLGTDEQIEAFVEEYKTNHHDLPWERWKHYREVFSSIVNNASANPTEKILASGLYELCSHKLKNRSNFFEPTVPPNFPQI